MNEIDHVEHVVQLTNAIASFVMKDIESSEYVLSRRAPALEPALPVLRWEIVNVHHAVTTEFHHKGSSSSISRCWSREVVTAKVPSCSRRHKESYMSCLGRIAPARKLRGFTSKASYSCPHVAQFCDVRSAILEIKTCPYTQNMSGWYVVEGHCGQLPRWKWILEYSKSSRSCRRDLLL